MLLPRYIAGSVSLLTAALLVGTTGCSGSGDGSGFAELDDEGTGGGSGDADNPCGLLPREGKVVLGYLPWWSDFSALTASMDLGTLTHIALAFTNPTGVGGATTFPQVSTQELTDFVTLAHANGVKVIASIGGAGESELIHEQLAADKVDAYVDELVSYVEEFNLDGVDVDIEGSVVDATYGPFVQKLAARLHPEGRLVTAAVAQWFQEGITDEALFCFDFINEMSYDAAGGWSDPGEHASRSFASGRAQYWENIRGVDPERIVIGVPFYGYCWGTGCANDGSQIRFSNIQELYPDQVAGDWIRDTENDVTINFNGTDTIEYKASLSQEYGGIMIWDLSQDTSEATLFEALKKGLE